MNTKGRVALDILIILFSALLSAVALYVFVFTANFAPSGVDGISTMLQRLTGLNAGYFSFLINAPLLLIAWFKLDKKYVLYTLLFTAVSSGLLVLLEEIEFYQYFTEVDVWIPAVFSGVLMGIRTGLMIRIGGSTGGTDIVGCLVQKARPYIEVERPIAVLCYLIIALSFLVYGSLNSVLVAIVQTFVMSYVMGRVLHSSRNAVEAKIITDDPESFKEEIVQKLKHGATVVKGEGMFTGDQKSMVFTIINIRQMKELMDIARNHPNSFVYFSDVNGVWGNFRWRSTDEVR